MTTVNMILTEVRDALAQSDYARLSSLSAMLETVFLPTDAKSLGLATRLARENAAFLQSAGNGIRAAQRRMAELRNANRLSVYDAQGKRQQATPPGEKARRL